MAREKSLVGKKKKKKTQGGNRSENLHNQQQQKNLFYLAGDTGAGCTIAIKREKERLHQIVSTTTEDIFSGIFFFSVGTVIAPSPSSFFFCFSCSGVMFLPHHEIS